MIRDPLRPPVKIAIDTNLLLVVWRGALMLLSDPGIEERSCQIRDVHNRPGYLDILVALGPADAGLIYVAELEGSTILTDDGLLAHWAGVRSVPALRLEQIGR